MMLTTGSVDRARDPRTRYVGADAADATPLVGMRLLDRHNLNIDVEAGVWSSRPKNSRPPPFQPFEGRMTRLEEKAAVGPENEE